LIETGSPAVVVNASGYVLLAFLREDFVPVPPSPKPSLLGRDRSSSAAQMPTAAEHVAMDQLNEPGIQVHR